MHYDGAFDVTGNKEKVFDFLTDPKKMTTIFPDIQNVKILDENNFTLKAKVGMSFIKGTMDVKGTISEKKRPTMAKVKARGTGINSSVDLDSIFTIADGANGGTHVTWSADAKISGMMASVGSRLIDSASDKYVKQIIGALQKNLS
jgi:uncharacterized protein